VTSAAQAAQALEPVAGSYASILFAAGFIGSGVLAVPVLAASGAAGLSSLLNKDWGLDRSPRKAPLFYGLLGVGIILGTVLAVRDTNPIGLLVLSAIVNGIAAGPFLISQRSPGCHGGMGDNRHHVHRGCLWNLVHDLRRIVDCWISRLPRIGVPTRATASPLWNGPAACFS